MRRTVSVRLLFFAILLVSVQLNSQSVSDSLMSMWLDEQAVDSLRIDAYSEYIRLNYLKSDADSALILVDGLLQYTTKRNDKYGIVKALDLKSKAYFIKTDYPTSLKYLEQCLSMATEINEKKVIAKAQSDLGVIYYFQKEHDLALQYFISSRDLRHEIGDREGESTSYNNMGLIYKEKKRYDEAIDSYQKALQIRETSLDLKSKSYPLNNLAEVYLEMGDMNTALRYFNESIALKEKVNDLYGIRYSRNKMGNGFVSQGNFSKAIYNCEEALRLSEQIGDMQGISQSYACLYSASRELGNWEKALYYLESQYAIDDSIKSGDTKLQLQRFEFDKKTLADSLANVEQRKQVELAYQSEINEVKQRRTIFQGLALLTLILAGAFFFNWRVVKKSGEFLKEEKEKSDKLLLNILPQEVAEELKRTGVTKAREHINVSVLFTDIVGFTTYAEAFTAQELVERINVYFKAFDDICVRNNIEKIKTIGDAYMAVGGLNSNGLNASNNTVKAALEMLAFLDDQKKSVDDLPFDMRIGVHSGPVVAGVVGSSKFQFDVWGDTVNIASRMESNGIPGKLNISETTFQSIKNNEDLHFEDRGFLNVKGKGDMKMWLVQKAS